MEMLPAAIVMIEPWMVHPDQESSEYIKRNTAALVASAMRRRDTWGSRAESLAYFQSRNIWQRWDRRVLELYVVSNIY